MAKHVFSFPWTWLSFPFLMVGERFLINEQPNLWKQHQPSKKCIVSPQMNPLQIPQWLKNKQTQTRVLCALFFLRCRPLKIRTIMFSRAPLASQQLRNTGTNMFLNGGQKILKEDGRKKGRKISVKCLSANIPVTEKGHRNARYREEHKRHEPSDEGLTVNVL